MLKTERLEERSRFTVDIPARRPLSWLSDLPRRLLAALGTSTEVTCPRCGIQMERMADKGAYRDAYVMCSTSVWRCSVCGEKKEQFRAFSFTE
ncbi:MAG: hypothetical protein Q8O40_09775 [Chloroflexota bacterium]|nr:hypothetical protein [Chloroflexota bacterium]